MPTIKLQILLIFFMLLSSCAKKQLLVQELISDQQGVMTHSMVIKNQDGPPKILICFSEVNETKLIGISCQNDTGFHLFSGGMKDEQFELEKVSQFVLKIDTKTLVGYMKIALFSKYNILNANKHILTVSKDQSTTMIHDNKNQRIVEINLL